ncbi:MAG TPA: radical SAM protein [Nannocystaceae bacterium]|nr:radical SAM protein [Nannocystaceae bacterium]
MIDDELEARARELLAPLGIGDVLPGGTVLRSIATELGLSLVLERAGRSLRIDVVPRAAAREHKVLTQHFAIGHDAGSDALALCRYIAGFVEANEAAVLATIRAGAHDDEGRVREVRSAHALVRSQDGSFYALNPYSGCTIGCRFCYAQSRLQPLRALLGLREAAWGSWVDARVDAPTLLEGELRTLAPAPIKLCPIVADPWQAIERKLRITRTCLETIRDAPSVWPTLVLTRSAAVLDDLALLASLPRAFVGVSLPTVDDTVRAHFEPRAASVDERLAVLRAARDAGLRTFAVVQPLLPGPIDALADALALTTDGVALGELDGELDATALFDDPRYAHARTHAWQHDGLARLRGLLDARGIAVWRGELPDGAHA